MLGLIAAALLSAVLPRGLRPPIQHAPEAQLRDEGKLPVTPGMKRRGGRWGQHKLVCAALRAMPTYASNTERNAAKRLRKARRAKGIHGS